MNHRISRREFVRTGAGAGIAATAAAPFAGPLSPTLSPDRGRGRSEWDQAPAVGASRRVKPLVVASANGHQFKNGGPATCIEKAFSMITQGTDVLDAVIAGVNINELDPDDGSVGYGGTPNADGVVQLDASVMHGPQKRAGAVAALEGIRTPSLVARAVADHTDHHLLVGLDAQAFARKMGFAIETDLNTERSRTRWLEWKRRVDPEHYLDPSRREIVWAQAVASMIADGALDADHYQGTIHCSGLSAKGEICGVTTTSGLAFKIPGRVGDSPIFGAGLYVDPEVGAAGSTGRGEANLYNVCSYLVVDEMRRGRHPKDAGMQALLRIKANTVEKRLLNARGLPNFRISFYVLNAKGEHAGVTMYEGAQYAVCTDGGAETLPCDALFPKEAWG